MLFEAPREVPRGGRDGTRALGDTAQERPPVAARDHLTDPAHRLTTPQVQHRERGLVQRCDGSHADIHAVVHCVHDRDAVAMRESMPDERAPEVGLHVHEIDRRAGGERPIEEPVGATARPRHRVLPVERDRDRRQVEVPSIRRAVTGMHLRRDRRHGVTGPLEEPPLQPHRHLRSAEGFQVLIAEEDDVHD